MEYTEVREYLKKNRKAIYFLNASTEDYIGARVCFLNELINQGYIFSQQAIEKLLKSYILILRPTEPVESKKHYKSHDLIRLNHNLQQFAGIDLEKYSQLCKILTATFFEFRYPSEKSLERLPVNTFSTSLLAEVDEFYIDLFLRIPIPDPIKVGCGILGYLKLSKWETVKTHIVRNNLAYHSNINYFSHPLEWYMHPEKRSETTSSEISHLRVGN